MPAERPRPLIRAPAAAQPARLQQPSWWSRVAPCRLWTFFALALALCFPRVVALTVALFCKLVIRGMVALIVYFGRELYFQLSVSLAEVENSLVEWLATQLSGGGAGPPPLLQAPPGQQQQQQPQQPRLEPGVVPHPTRPLDLVTVVLLAWNVYQGLPVRGGAGVPGG